MKNVWRLARAAQAGLCLAALLMTSPAPAEEEAPLHILKVSAPDKAAWLRLFELGLDLVEAVPGPEVLVVGTDAEKEWLEAQGYTVQYELRHATRHFAARAQAAGAASMGGFRTLSECVMAIDSLVANYPSVVSTKLTIGLTDELRPMYALRISDNPNSDEGEPAVLFTGLHHAREPMSTHIVIHTMQQLAWNYGSDSLITALVNEREIWFIPFVNPDGYYHNEQIAPAGGGMWRKNRHNNGDNSFGVDPNRNYGDHWGWDDLGSSPNPASDTYRGSGPFSERENQAVRDFCLARPQIRIAFNYHSYSNLLLWAPGYEASYTPHQALFAAIADSATSWNNYTATPGWGLYLTNGDSDDWMYFDRNILAFTPEVGNSGDGFWPDPDRIEPLTNENYPANLFIIEIADAPERIMPPAAPQWDSIKVTGPDSTTLALYWNSPETLAVNQPVMFRVHELFGPYQVADGLESGADYWSLDGFTRTSAASYQGAYSLYSGNGNSYAATARIAEPMKVQAGDSLRFFIIYGLELNYDYAYVEVSTDGGQSFSSLPGNITTNYNPTGNNMGNGITGNSGGWVPAWFDLADFVGQEVLLRLAYRTDGGVLGFGVYVDNVYPVQIYDSSNVAASTAGLSCVLPDHPEGEYYFRLEGEDAQGQVSWGETRSILFSSGYDFLLGDVDESGTITSADIVRLVNFVFKGGPAPLPVWQAGDVDGSGTLTAGDIIFLVNYVFKGGPAPGT